MPHERGKREEGSYFMYGYGWETLQVQGTGKRRHVERAMGRLKIGKADGSDEVTTEK